MNWQPIDTVPRDGSVVLLASKSGLCLGWWDDDCDCVVDHEGALDVTHWTPAPEPPA